MQGRGFCLLLIANCWKNKTNQETAFQNFLGDRRLFGRELSAAAQCLGAASHRLRDAAAQAGVCHGPVSLGMKVLGLPQAKESPGCALAHSSTGFWTQVPRHGCTELGQVSASTPPRSSAELGCAACRLECPERVTGTTMANYNSWGIHANRLRNFSPTWIFH